jgi:formylmethanofuran dehydrogenase subunit D
MKIQKRFLRKHKDKEYYKYMVNLPPMVVKEAGIDYGDEVEVRSEDGKIVLEKKTGNKSEEKDIK